MGMEGGEMIDASILKDIYKSFKKGEIYVETVKLEYTEDGGVISLKWIDAICRPPGGSE